MEGDVLEKKAEAVETGGLDQMETRTWFGASSLPLLDAWGLGGN